MGTAPAARLQLADHALQTLTKTREFSRIGGPTAFSLPAELVARAECDLESDKHIQQYAEHQHYRICFVADHRLV